MSENKIEIQLPGNKSVFVRPPTDEEWLQRQRGRTIVVRDLGRGVTESTVPGLDKSDADLCSKIILDGPALEEGEASMVANVLSEAEVEDVLLEGDAAVVTLRTMRGSHAHRLKKPSAKQMMDYRRSIAKPFDLPYNKQEIRVYPETGAKLYDELVDKDGKPYTDVAVIHKAAVAGAVVNALQREMESPRFL